MNYFIIFIIIVILLSNVNSNPTIADNMIPGVSPNHMEENFLQKLNGKCLLQDNHSCMMFKLLTHTNNIFKRPTIAINKNLEFTKTRGMESFTTDQFISNRALHSDEETLGTILAEKLWNFIRTRTLRYKIFDNTDLIVLTEPKGSLNVGLSINPLSESNETGRGKMKNLGPLVGAFLAKMALFGALAIKGLVLLTGKALIVSKIALVLAVILGLKKLLNKNHVTYEVVPHAHISHEPHHGYDSYSSGWARTLNGFIEGMADVPNKILQAQDMAYAKQKPISI